LTTEPERFKFPSANSSLLSRIFLSVHSVPDNEVATTQATAVALFVSVGLQDDPINLGVNSLNAGYVDQNNDNND
jgi:hypothetical protein